MPEGVDRAGETENQVEALKRAVTGLRDAIYDLRLESARERPLVRAVESIVELNRQIGEGCQFELIEDGFPATISGLPVWRCPRRPGSAGQRQTPFRRQARSSHPRYGERRGPRRDRGRW